MAATIDEDQVWQDIGGKPIVNGSIFIGIQNQDPVLNPITIFSDRDLTVTIANPQTTDSFGRSTNKIWIPGKYSITVQDSDSVQKYSELDAGEASQTGISNLTNIQGVDTITADGNPTITVLVDQELFTFTAIGTITGAVTLQIDSTAAKSVLKYHDQPLVAGDWELDQVIMVMFNSTDDVFELISNTADHNFVDLSVSGSADFVNPPTINGAEITINIIKSADEEVTNSTTLQADDELLFNLEANTTYAIEFHIEVEADTNGPTVKYDWTHPASTLFLFSGFTYDAAAVTLAKQQSETNSNGTIIFDPGVFIDSTYSGSGIIRNGANAGNFTFEWAQNVIDAANGVIVKKGSWIKHTKL